MVDDGEMRWRRRETTGQGGGKGAMRRGTKLTTRTTGEQQQDRTTTPAPALRPARRTMMPGRQGTMVRRKDELVLPRLKPMFSHKMAIPFQIKLLKFWKYLTG
jgi:hypothetical protein